MMEFSLEKPEGVEAQIRQQNDALARLPDVPASLQEFALELAREVNALPREARNRVDRDVMEAIQQGCAGALLALHVSDPVVARREMRIRLEQLRQGFSDLTERLPVIDDQPPGAIARWLADTLGGVPNNEIASLLGVHVRTFQRWCSGADEFQTRSREGMRLRALARIVNNLRHVFTPAGVLQWLRRPHPALDERPPLSLLEDPDGVRTVLGVAFGVRSMGAS